MYKYVYIYIYIDNIHICTPYRKLMETTCPVPTLSQPGFLTRGTRGSAARPGAFSLQFFLGGFVRHPWARGQGEASIFEDGVPSKVMVFVCLYILTLSN